MEIRAGGGCRAGWLGANSGLSGRACWGPRVPALQWRRWGVDMALLVKIVAGTALLYLVGLVATHFLQRRLIYAPDTERYDPKTLGLAGVDEFVFETPDGERIVAWYAKAAEGHPTLLYFHGNAGSLETRQERIRKYSQRGFGVFMMTYRSYGGSTGAPSEKANVADAKQAYEELVKLGVKPSDIIVYGESLGTGIAVQVAGAKPVAGVILDAPYTALVDVAEVHYPRLPSRSFMTDRYETLRHLPRVEAPLLIIHGKEDRVVPVAMGQAVHAAAKGTKEIAVFPGAGHSDHYNFGSYDAIYDWVARLRTGRISPVENLAAE